MNAFSPGQVGADAEFPVHAPGHHGVLVVAEHGLDLLHLLGEPPGLLAQGRADRLARVPGPLGRLPGLVVGDVRGPAGVGALARGASAAGCAGRLRRAAAGSTSARPGRAASAGQRRARPAVRPARRAARSSAPSPARPGRPAARPPASGRNDPAPGPATGPSTCSGGVVPQVCGPAGSPAPRRRGPRRARRRAISARPISSVVRARGMTSPNDCRVLRSRRAVTRIWCTESGSSAADQRIERPAAGPPAAAGKPARPRPRTRLGGWCPVAVGGGPPLALGQPAGQRTFQLGRAGPTAAARPGAAARRPPSAAARSPPVSSTSTSFHWEISVASPSVCGRDVVGRDLGQRVARRRRPGSAPGAGYCIRATGRSSAAAGVPADQPGQLALVPGGQPGRAAA